MIRSDLKFSAALRSRAGHMFKTVQPCGWCFVSVGAMGFYGLAWYLRTPSDAYASILFVFIIFSLELILLVQRSSWIKRQYIQVIITLWLISRFSWCNGVYRDSPVSADTGRCFATFFVSLYFLLNKLSKIVRIFLIIM